MNAERGRTLPDIAALAPRFDAFFVDQFGVLHDGRAAYPGAVEGLARLSATGKPVVLLSNSGKRAAPNEKRLLSLGFRPGTWTTFLTSGEVAWRIFTGRDGHAPLAAGTRCLYFARDNDRTAIEGLDLTIVDQGKDADLVLIAGSEGEHFPLDFYRVRLQAAARRGVPAFCTNPDKIMLTKSGPRFGAGRIAELYEELGGTVHWIGKPFPDIYRVAMDLIGGPDPGRVVCVGDSIEHDIAGGRAAGFGTALVRSGILDGMAEEDLAALFSRHGAAPDYIVPRFVWSAVGERTP